MKLCVVFGVGRLSLSTLLLYHFCIQKSIGKMHKNKEIFLDFFVHFDGAPGRANTRSE